MWYGFEWLEMIPYFISSDQQAHECRKQLPGASNLSIHSCYIISRYCTVTHHWAGLTCGSAVKLTCVILRSRNSCVLLVVGMTCAVCWAWLLSFCYCLHLFRNVCLQTDQSVFIDKLRSIVFLNRTFTVIDSGEDEAGSSRLSIFYYSQGSSNHFITLGLIQLIRTNTFLFKWHILVI